MATTLKIASGNTAPYWQITCERDGVAIPLSGATVTVDIAKGNTVVRTAGVCTILDSVNGVISYTPTASDTSLGGTFKVDVKITYGDATDEVLYEQLKVKTRPRIIPA